MLAIATLPVARRPELLIGRANHEGQRVITDPNTGISFQMGEQEAFLLQQLDGMRLPDEICAAFGKRFGETLSENELQQFLDIAWEQGLLKPVADDWAATATVLRDSEEDYRELYAASGRLFERSKKVVAGLTTHDRRGFGPFPVFVERADGAVKWDVSGCKLIDYWIGHGALLCGHNYPPVVEAILRQATRGTHYGACHEIEVRWAELVCRLIPCAERVRFTASGTEATQLALRVARAYTGRPIVVKFDGHFHGWHDEAMAHFYDQAQSGFSPGAINQVGVADMNDLATLEAALKTKEVAGVILEPGGGSSGAMPWSKEFLKTVRTMTRDHGTLLIFDEVISGFRDSPGGIQQLTGVTPDLTTLAKILCGGLPGGAVVGKAEFMAVFGPGTRGPAGWAQVPHTGTYNGNPLSGAAGIALLEGIADGAAQAKARRAAEAIVRGVNEAAEEEQVDVFLFNNRSSTYHMLIGARHAGLPLGPGMGVKTLSTSHPHRYALLRRALLLEGVDVNPYHGWVSAVHDDAVVAATVEAFARAFHRLRDCDGLRL
jgi:glutamate-1-semialdehyde 2,1-aminomutase